MSSEKRFRLLLHQLVLPSFLSFVFRGQKRTGATYRIHPPHYITHNSFCINMTAEILLFVFVSASHRILHFHYQPQALTSRLLPALRAFNPDLVLLSAGFDAAKGDVGNCRQERRGSSGGLDLQAEDYLWTTERVSIERMAVVRASSFFFSFGDGGCGSKEGA